MGNWFDDYEEGTGSSVNQTKDMDTTSKAEIKPQPVKETVLEEKTEVIIPDDINIDVAPADDTPKETDVAPKPKQKQKTNAQAKADAPAADITYIGSTCVVEGNLRNDGALTIAGRIYGDANITGDIVLEETGCIKNSIHATGNVVIKGNVGEKIHTSGLITITNQAKVHGDMQTAKDIEIDHGCVIIGNMECQNAVIDGAVKGDVTITENIVLKEHAIVKGSIKAASLHISPGAIIDGSCVLTNQEYDAKSIFGE